MTYCDPYLVFQQKARRLVAEAKALYTKTNNSRVITKAKRELNRLAQDHLRRLPNRHCVGAACLFTELQRLLTDLDELSEQGVKERYQEILAEICYAREIQPKGGWYLAMGSSRVRRRKQYLRSPTLTRERSKTND